MAKIKIETTEITGEAGFVKLPKEMKLYCSICKALLEDKEQCLVKFIKVPSRISPTGFVLGVATDCQGCGKEGLPPAIKA
jgi:RNase P subunit RPR2